MNPPPNLGLEVVVNLVVVSSVVVWVLGWKLLTLFGPNLGLKPAALAPEKNVKRNLKTEKCFKLVHKTTIESGIKVALRLLIL